MFDTSPSTEIPPTPLRPGEKLLVAICITAFPSFIDTKLVRPDTNFVSPCGNSNWSASITKDPSLSGAELIKEIDVNKLLTFDESSIDLMLPTLLIEYGLDSYVVNGKYPERVLSIMNDDDCSFEYTFIHMNK